MDILFALQYYSVHRRTLSLAIIFINSENIFVQELAYRIIVICENRAKDYLPLYEIAVNKSLYHNSSLQPILVNNAM